MLRQLLPLLFVSSFVFAQGAEVAVPATPGPVSDAGLLPGGLLPEGLAERIRDEGIGNSQAMRLLRDLTGKVGHRLTGSDNFSKACDWAAQEFHAMGVPSVQLEKWGEWKLAWNRGAWIGRITNPVAMELYVATDAWTAGTNGPKVGVIAPGAQRRGRDHREGLRGQVGLLQQAAVQGAARRL
jgi:carboxypeptidase Q